MNHAWLARTADGAVRDDLLVGREAARISFRRAELIAKGLPNREIATALTVSEKTAANHVEHIMTKVYPRSRAQIAVWAVEQHHAAAHT